MHPRDSLQFALHAVTAHRLRTVLMLLAMAIGVAAVVVLTALGESARRYVTGEFAALGTNLLIILPGRNETTGGAPPLLGETPRDLTIDDALALLRSPHIDRVAPIMAGSAPLSYAKREREVTVLGSTAEFAPVRHVDVAQGRFLSPGDPHRAAPECVIGHKVRDELFGAGPVLGEWLRLGDRRYRVVGVLGDTGMSIGVELDDVAIIPVAGAQVLFNRQSLFRVIAQGRPGSSMQDASADIRRIVRERHEGEDDVTIITQDAVVQTFDRIFKALTYGVAGIAAISLVVAGILIMNVMLVAVTQRTAEIGLLKAIGAPGRVIKRLFVTEALLLTVFGAALGLVLGLAVAALLRRLYPVLPITPPGWAIVAAVGVALVTGMVFGVLPATRAARLDPVTALSRR